MLSTAALKRELSKNGSLSVNHLFIILLFIFFSRPDDIQLNSESYVLDDTKEHHIFQLFKELTFTMEKKMPMIISLHLFVIFSICSLPSAHRRSRQVN